MSVAGKRAGIIEGERSNLFFQAIRIIREMREATNNQYPRFCVWENVCFDADTLITCEDGYRRIADVSVGQKVKTLSGRYLPVMKLHQTKNQEVIRIRFQGSEDLIVTPNHPVYAVRKIRGKKREGILGLTGPEWIPAGDLTIDHLVAYGLDQPSLPDDFISEAEAWAVGRWTADGSVDLKKSNPRMFFSIGIGKEELAREKLGRLPYAIYENKPHPTATNFCFTSKEFYALIADAGRGAGNKRVPPYVFQLPINLQKEVLEGYISGDGYIRERDHGRELCAGTASRELAYGIARLIRNVYHVAAGISVQKAKGGNIQGREIVPNYPIYQVFASLDSKSRKTQTEGKIVWQPVKSIERLGEKRTVYNLSVMEDNTYAANDIIVHNCGAFTSNKGEDFKAVLNAIVGIVEKDAPSVPSPEKGRWPKADTLVGNGWSIAYRTFDSQWWGVPQRRKRIFLVGDLGGGRAADILFKSEGVSGYSPEGFRAWQRAANGAEAGAGATGRGIPVVNPQGSSGISITEDVTGTLVAQDHGHHPAVLDEGSKVAGFLTENSAASRSIGYEEEKSPTVRASNTPAVLYDAHGRDARYSGPHEVSPTLSRYMGTGSGNVPLKVEPAYSIGKEGYTSGEKANFNFSVDEELAPTIQASGAGAVAAPENDKPQGTQAFGIGSFHSRGMLSENPHAGIYEADTARTLDQSGGTPECHQGGMAVVETYAMTTGSYTQVDREISPPLMARDYKDPNIVNEMEAASATYRVRRLTPIECARLQGFPDEWCSNLETENPTEEEIDFWMDVFETWGRISNPGGKPKQRSQVIRWLKNPYTDSAVYRLYGNGISLPIAYFILAGIAWAADSEQVS